jgi:hypothetical protein
MMRFQRYLDQVAAWPTSGRQILAQFDENSIFVYQAFRPAIAQYAVDNQRFGGEFSFDRMSWIKPNFLWMMYRSGWAAKEGQEQILAIRLRRTFFDELLQLAVPSSFDQSPYDNRNEWQLAVASSDVRLQWDPDHDPMGQPVQRRAIQLGLRRTAIRRYGEQELLSVEDITPFVVEQRQNIPGKLAGLRVPEERVYRPADQKAAKAVGIDFCVS